MIKALLLVFAPGVAWERILRVKRGVGFILMVYLLPLLVLGALALLAVGSMGIALGIGAILGYLVSRRGSRNGD